MNLYQPIISGSLEVSGSVTINGTLRVLSGSVLGTASIAENALLLNNLDSGSFVGTGSFASLSSSFATTSGSVSSRLVTQEAASASFAAQSASLSTRLTTDESNYTSLSSSFATTSGSISGRVAIIEGQDATTGSNNFTAPQQISDVSNAISFTSTASLYTDGGLRVAKDSFVSGTAYFNNITVYGTSSIEYITSSQVNIGSNIITVNTDTPAVRFGGLSVFDSGSTQLTGSMLWDSQTNHWVYSNPSGSSYSGGMIMSGPRSSALGSEQGTLNNYVMKGQGGDHITSSQIIDDGTVVRIPGSLQVTGSTVLSSALTGSSALFGGLLTINVPTDNTTVGIFHTGGGTADRGLKISTFVATNDNAGVTLDAQTSTGILAFATAGAEKMRITSNGNVGFNTSSPNSLGGYTIYTFNTESTRTNGSIIDLNISGTRYSTLFTTTGGTYFGSNQNVPLILLTNGDEKMRITSGGYLKASNTGIYLGSTGAYHELRQSAQSTASTVISATNASFDNNVLAIGSTRASSSAFNLIAAYANDFNDLKFVVRGDGNVGIGGTTPLSMLHVSETTSGNFTAESRIGGNTTAFGVVTNFTQSGATSGSIYVSPGYTNASIIFKLGAGVGNTNQLVLKGDSTVAINTTNTIYAQLNIKQTSSQLYGGIALYSNDGTETFLGLGNIGSVCGLFATYGANGAYVPITFSTGGGERMRIATNGDVTFGVTSTYDTALLWRSDFTGAVHGRIYATGLPRIVAIAGESGGVQLLSGATSWTSNSDERLKNINGEIENAVEKLLTLKAVNFSWKSDVTNKENLGLIAQEVEKQFPQIIDKAELPKYGEEEQLDKTEYLGVRYTELIPVLVKAIQEQQAQIEELKAEFDEYKTTHP